MRLLLLIGLLLIITVSQPQLLFEDDFDGIACQRNAHCSAVEYCVQSKPGATGACERRPEVCPDVFMPVCGFDNVTYSNACDAAQAGVNVLFEGECQLPNTAGSFTTARRSDALAYRRLSALYGGGTWPTALHRVSR